MRKFIAAILLFGAVLAAMVGAGCQPYPYYPNPYPTRPAWCQPGYDCQPTAGNPSVYPPVQRNPNEGFTPPSDGYHWIWRDAKGLHIQFKSYEFQMLRDAKYGGGLETVDVGHFNKKLKSDRVGWSIPDGPELVQEQAHALRFMIPAPDGMVDGEKFNFAFSHPNLIVWLNSRMTKTGTGVRRVGNADGSEAFVVDSTKTSTDL